MLSSFSFISIQVKSIFSSVHIFLWFNDIVLFWSFKIILILLFFIKSFDNTWLQVIRTGIKWLLSSVYGILQKNPEPNPFGKSISQIELFTFYKKYIVDSTSTIPFSSEFSSFILYPWYFFI